MTRQTRKGEKRGNNGRLDMFNKLPDEVLCHIISLLSIDEVVRSSILSKRWKPLWKDASCLDFDGRHMIKPLSQLQNPSSGKVTFDPTKATKKDARLYGRLVYRVLRCHSGNLTSCRFRHFPQSLAAREMENWVKFVMQKNKKLSFLSLECEPLIKKVNRIPLDKSRNVKINFQPGIFSNLYSLELTNYALNSLAPSAFESSKMLQILKFKKLLMKDEIINGILKNCLFLEKFSLIESTGFKEIKIQNPSLKFLELQWLIVDEIDVSIEDLQAVVLNSLICPPKGLRIFAPNLKSFHSRCNVISQRMQANSQRQHLLKSQDIIENCSGLLGFETTNIFRNLLTLSIDLDLNNIREAFTLSFILRSCLYLETLEITIPVDKGLTFSGSSNECALPFPNSTFWEKRGLYNCINHKLKYATIRGFTGKEQEVKFATHLIANANMIEKISIICDSSIVDEATNLLSLPRASVFSLHHIEVRNQELFC